MKNWFVIGMSVLLLTACAEEEETPEALTAVDLPAMRWNAVSDSAEWNAAMLQALDSHGRPLVEIVPEDIEQWCPGYTEADEAERKAFWIGFASALAKHESTYRETAVNPNGKWFGLLQISPATARGYECRAGSGEALKNGEANLSCALRIMAVTVPRDGVIDEYDGRWRGVAADWGPLRVSSKREDMVGWLKKQPYCQS